jgi:hypothetical protein
MTGQARRMIRLARRAPGLAGALAVALLIAAVFGLRLANGALTWQDVPADPAIAGWMTPRYVVRSWDVPPDLVAGALDLERDGIGRRVTLTALAEERGVPPAVLIDALETAIAAHRENRP